MNAPHPPVKPHIAALRRFAIAITLLNVLGHTVFGFEQSWAQPLVALTTAYGTELLLEFVDARANRRPPRYVGGFRAPVDFLLAPHITGLACAMLLYANDRLWPVAFATAVAIGSKTLFRVPVGNSTRHFYNPSNFGITVTLLLFPWVGIAQPYMFTENIHGIGDWLLPAAIIISGSLLNITLTRRLPLILTWVGCFAVQALLRSQIFNTPLIAPLLPMTGVAWILYTFYMVTDPATTPQDTKGQIAFGAIVGLTYGLLVVNHIVFGLFFALTLVCTVRGVGIYIYSLAMRNSSKSIAVPTQAPAVVPVYTGERKPLEGASTTAGGGS